MGAEDRMRNLNTPSTREALTVRGQDMHLSRAGAYPPRGDENGKRNVIDESMV